VLLLIPNPVRLLFGRAVRRPFAQLAVCMHPRRPASSSRCALRFERTSQFSGCRRVQPRSCTADPGHDVRRKSMSAGHSYLFAGEECCS